MKRETKKIIDFTTWLEKYIIKEYGKRCKERCMSCTTCQIWDVFDELNAFCEHIKWLDEESKSHK